MNYQKSKTSEAGGAQDAMARQRSYTAYILLIVALAILVGTAMVLVVGEDQTYRVLGELGDVPVIGVVIVSLLRLVLAIYFPPFLVTGGPSPYLVGFGVLLVAAAFLAYKTRYLAALAVLLVPMLITWGFSWQFMGD